MIPIRFIKSVPIPLALIALFLFLSLLASCDQSDSKLGGPTLAICRGQVDSDQDGVCDILENQIGTNPQNPNTDSPVDPFPDGADFNPTNDGRAFTNSGGQTGWIPLGILSGTALILWAKDHYFNGDDSIDSNPNDPTDTLKIVWENSYIQFFQTSFNGVNSEGRVITWVEVTNAAGVKFVHLGVEKFSNIYPEAICPNCSITGVRDTVNYQFNPGIDGEATFSSSETTKAAFEAVELGDLDRIRNLNGQFLRRSVNNDPEYRYDSFDPEGVRYRREFNGWYTDSVKPGFMQFWVRLKDDPFSSLSEYYPNINFDWTHPCSVAFNRRYDNEPHPHHIHRCLMFTYASRNAAKTWVRKDASAFPERQEDVMPWEGKWMRTKQ